MNSRTSLNQTRTRRDARTRAKIFGTAATPRLTVFRSNRAFYAQLIDDEKGYTLASVSLSVKGGSASGGKDNKTAQAQKLGMKLAEKAVAVKITKAKFDRGRYPYHGRVKAFVEGVRAGGLVI
ncbi:MAG: 50S ribosomal protein L18 [Candidatus Liptonbacteria bacterium RIFCSPLOWO2_01_FULL_53_13]|uniref:Large ribosomal subunit protein uL18 n=1 Tax=Candidatus Liptonbacteria bacterium RIFCSPLOWO2_01_FULL_53_13 TaxID=1798651 RepID=A0A1G2CL18_9BACT|nr:MAG: 50S ribosomal protein L18 [Candidatus Liptonbacteria bacterium RIFCSPLOWO2_01_FULL_53_13]